MSLASVLLTKAPSSQHHPVWPDLVQRELVEDLLLIQKARHIAHPQLAPELVFASTSHLEAEMADKTKSSKTEGPWMNMGG